MIIKVHPTPNGKLVAMCDSDILGKVFEEGDRQLDLSANFYQGEERAVEEVETLLKGCYMVNAVGKDSVGFLLKKKMIEKDNIQEVGGVPYAQCVVAGVD